jgi:hypothetical protein
VRWRPQSRAAARAGGPGAGPGRDRARRRRGGPGARRRNRRRGGAGPRLGRRRVECGDVGRIEGGRIEGGRIQGGRGEGEGRRRGQRRGFRPLHRLEELGDVERRRPGERRELQRRHLVALPGESGFELGDPRLEPGERAVALVERRAEAGDLGVARGDRFLVLGDQRLARRVALVEQRGELVGLGLRLRDRLRLRLRHVRRRVLHRGLFGGSLLRVRRPLGAAPAADAEAHGDERHAAEQQGQGSLVQAHDRPLAVLRVASREPATRTKRDVWLTRRIASAQALALQGT